MRISFIIIKIINKNELMNIINIIIIFKYYFMEKFSVYENT